MAALAQQAGVPMTHVPFRGSAEAIIALLRDDVSIYADLPGGLRANNLVGVGVMAERRTAEFPETPTLREQGFDLVYSIWAGLYAPAATPPEFLARLEAACARALRAPAVMEGFERLATPITFRGQRRLRCLPAGRAREVPRRGAGGGAAARGLRATGCDGPGCARVARASQPLWRAPPRVDRAAARWPSSPLRADRREAGSPGGVNLLWNQ